MSPLPFYLSPPGPHWYDGRVRFVSLDFETTNKERGDPRNPANRLVRVCVDGRIVSDWDLDEIFSTPCVLVAHNAKFEMGWLLRYGIPLHNILPWDTMLAEYVLAGNRPAELSLAATMKRYGIGSKDPVIDGMMRNGVCPSEMPDHWLDARVISDTLAASQLQQLQYAALEEAGLLPVFFSRCIVTPVLTSIERAGMQLDPKRVDEAYHEAVVARNIARTELDGLTGGINLRSSKQKAAFLYDTLKFDELMSRGEPRRTPSGGRMTDAPTLEALKVRTPEQKAFLAAYKKFAAADAALVKTLEFFKAVCDSYDCTMYGSYNQAVTQTHRLSSSGRRVATPTGMRGVQFQNLPRQYKELVVGGGTTHMVVEVDYSQLEFVVAGALGNDAQVARDVAAKADVHRFTASVLNRCAEADVKPEQRQKAKASTFKPLYGGTSGTPREVEYYEQFRLKYAGVAATQKGWVHTVLRDGSLRTASGLVFYWPDTRVTHTGYITNTANIYNYPIQSFATADIVLIGLTFLFWRAQHLARIVNTVHDSVIALVDKKEVSEYAEIVGVALRDDVIEYLRTVYGFTTPLTLRGELKGGAFWGADEFKGTF